MAPTKGQIIGEIERFMEYARILQSGKGTLKTLKDMADCQKRIENMVTNL